MSQLEKNLSKLPDHCAAMHPTENFPILIKKGESGYYPLSGNEENVDQYNKDRDVTPQQVEAMLAGSVFGFQVPGADPDIY